MPSGPVVFLLRSPEPSAAGSVLPTPAQSPSPVQTGFAAPVVNVHSHSLDSHPQIAFASTRVARDSRVWNVDAERGASRRHDPSTNGASHAENAASSLPSPTLSEPYPALPLVPNLSTDPYEQHIRSRIANSRPVAIPVLTSVTCNIDQLAETLLNRCGDYAGLIVTSKRAVEALEEAWTVCEKDEGFSTTTSRLWLSKPVYAVGRATATAATRIGFTPSASESGSAEQLGRFIVERGAATPAPQAHLGSGSDSGQAGASEARPLTLLFLAGDKRMPTLPAVLASAGRAMEELIVYRTAPRDDLAEALDAAVMEHGVPDWMVAFSPSGVDAVLGAVALRDGGKGREGSHGSPGDIADVVSGARWACIGETTAKRVREAGLVVGCVAGKPTAEGLADAVAVACGEGRR